MSHALLLTLALAAALPPGSPAQDASRAPRTWPPGLNRLVREHRVELEALDSDYRRTLGAHADRSISLDSLFILDLDKVENPDRSPVVRLIVYLQHASLNRYSIKLPRRFIEDRLVIDMLLTALQHDDKGVRSLAAQTLAASVRPSQILDAVPLILSSDARYRLTDLLLRTDDARAASFILGETYLPDEYLAHLGDCEAEARLVDEFVRCTDPHRKRELVRGLGIAGTELCGRALCQELRTPLFDDSGFDGYAVRYDVMAGLGRVFPEEYLLTEEAIHVANEGLDRYFEDVESFCQTRFGTTWTTPRPTGPRVRFGLCALSAGQGSSQVRSDR